MRTSAVAVVSLLCLAPAPRTGAPAIEYALSFPAPEHRWMQVHATFSDVARDRPLELRMSRSSPGRYALHEFAKNVYEVRAYDSGDRPLTIERPDPHQWDVSGHDGTVRVVYNVYGDQADGTYLAVDTTHAHLNMPASLMWARGLEDRPARVRFEIPTDSGWRVATQLYPTGGPAIFTAPNLQYLMDSPAELSDHAMRQFVVFGPDGRPATFRVALHHDGSAADADLLAADVEKVAREEGAIFGEFPEFEPGAYTFLLDYLPYVQGDGMEHRNSTVITGQLSTASAMQRRAALGTISHELFHAWNVERIRPRSLEPFDFEKANMAAELWLAEGFTSYYGPLVLQRAGLASLDETVNGFGLAIDAVVNSPGRRIRSAADASRLAPFVDAARAVDRTNFTTTFISYYTFGAAIGLGLDLSLRDRSDGRVTLDGYMRALWRAYGKPGGPAPGLVSRPYVMRDLRETLAEISGDRAFADQFFDRYIEGHDAIDYGRLAARAGLVLRASRPGRAWIGALGLDGSTAAGSGRSRAVSITRLVPFGTPAYVAGLEQDDVITGVNGKTVSSASDVDGALRGARPGDRLEIAFERRGQPARTTVTAAEDPALELVTLESTRGAPTPAQRAFRDAWLRSRLR